MLDVVIAAEAALVAYDNKRGHKRADEGNEHPFAPIKEAKLTVSFNWLEFLAGRKLLKNQERSGMDNELEPDDVYWQVKQRKTAKGTSAAVATSGICTIKR